MSIIITHMELNKKLVLMKTIITETQIIIGTTNMELKKR